MATLERDMRWNEIDFDTHCQTTVPQIFLKSTIDKNVRDSFRLVIKLLELSYFDYEVYDAGTHRALVTFELALKRRFTELNQEEWPKKKPLVKLIDWFEKAGYFEVYNPLYLDKLREIRNHITHPSFYSFGGPALGHLITGSADLINDLYEDPELRRERMNIVIQVNNHLSSITSNGAILKIDDDDEVLIHSARVGFVNNKTEPNTISVVFVKPFKINAEDNNNTLMESPFILQDFSSYECNDAGIEFTQNNNKTSLYPIGNSFKEEYSAWRTQYDANIEKIAYDYMINEAISDFYRSSKQKFHDEKL